MTSEDLGCYSCSQQALGTKAPLRERIAVGQGWRIAHSFNSSLEGWLIVVPHRHVTSLDELSDAEAVELGQLLHKASTALRTVTGCEKTYVMQFSEAEGFHHLHFHLVPRPVGLSKDHLGPNIFHFLRQPATDWVSPERQDELAARLSAAISAGH
jgi:diadenosine tetraphosphate (Ap4A) HIT family hydrolase